MQEQHHFARMFTGTGWSRSYKLDGVFIYCFVSQEGAPGNEWHERRFNDIEEWWGFFRSDGTPLPAYDYLVERMRGR